QDDENLAMAEDGRCHVGWLAFHASATPLSHHRREPANPRASLKKTALLPSPSTLAVQDRIGRRSRRSGTRSTRGTLWHLAARMRKMLCRSDEAGRTGKGNHRHVRRMKNAEWEVPRTKFAQ